jgi:HK97 family phage prohead protease
MKQKRVFETVINARGGEPSITISTAAVDRENDVLVPGGCDTKQYLRNPVVLYGHDNRELPVGAATSVSIDEDSITARWRWLEGDDRASRVRNAFEQGVLRAASVGFKPRAYEPRPTGGVRFTSWELLEFSLVPVPANPEAVRVLRSLDLDYQDDIELELVDDETLEFEPEDLAAACRATLPRLVQGALRDAVARGVRDGVLHARGRLDDAVTDPDAMRVRRASVMREVFDVDRTAVEAAVRGAVPKLVRVLVRDAAERAVRQLRGRLD